MIINKITNGFVIQQFDTKLNEFTSQEFMANDESQYEDIYGDIIDEDEYEIKNKYLSYEMIQPK